MPIVLLIISVLLHKRMKRNCRKVQTGRTIGWLKIQSIMIIRLAIIRFLLWWVILPSVTMRVVLVQDVRVSRKVSLWLMPVRFLHKIHRVALGPIQWFLCLGVWCIRMPIVICCLLLFVGTVLPNLQMETAGAHSRLYLWVGMWWMKISLKISRKPWMNWKFVPVMVYWVIWAALAIMLPSLLFIKVWITWWAQNFGKVPLPVRNGLHPWMWLGKRRRLWTWVWILLSWTISSVSVLIILFRKQKICCCLCRSLWVLAWVGILQ